MQVEDYLKRDRTIYLKVFMRAFIYHPKKFGELKTPIGRVDSYGDLCV